MCYVWLLPRFSPSKIQLQNWQNFLIFRYCAHNGGVLMKRMPLFTGQSCYMPTLIISLFSFLSSNNIKQSMHFWCSQVASGSFVIGKSLFCFCFIDYSTFVGCERYGVNAFPSFIAFSFCKLCKDMCSHIIPHPVEKHTHTHNICIFIYTCFLMVITQWCLINDDQTPFLSSWWLKLRFVLTFSTKPLFYGKTHMFDG